MKRKWFMALLLTFVLGLGWSVARAADVTITPLGQRTGEFCRADRALLFEDPNGTRVLYDPGRTVAGGTDPRLGDVDIMILSSVHSDHIGVGKLNQDPDNPAAVCGANPPLAATPNSNFAEIAAAKGSTVVVGGEMDAFLNAKIAAAGGGAGQAVILRHGGKRIIGGVQIAVVRADHSNGIPREILAAGLAASLAPDNLVAYVGPENGFVLTFSNGLVVYLSGDTGQTSDMAAVVRDYYGARVAVVNMGDIFSMGPEEAAFAINKLIKPKTAIPSHSNEEASVGGVVKPGSKTETFVNLVKKVKVILPLSGVPIMCDGKGKCTQ